MIALAPNHSALLVMDLQSDILAMLGDQAAGLSERAAGLIAAARAAQVKIIYVVVGFRPGYPEIHPRNASFVALAKSARGLVGTPGVDIAPALRPQEVHRVLTEKVLARQATVATASEVIAALRRSEAA